MLQLQWPSQALLLQRIAKVSEEDVSGKTTNQLYGKTWQNLEINQIRHLQPCLHWRTHEESCSYGNTKFLGILQFRLLGLSVDWPNPLSPACAAWRTNIFSLRQPLSCLPLTWVASEQPSRYYKNHPKRQWPKSEQSKAAQAALLQRKKSFCLEETYAQRWRGELE